MLSRKAFAVAVSVLGVCLLATIAHSAPPGTAQQCPAAVVPMVLGGPSIDGDLSDPVWTRAPALGPFVTIAGAEATNETQAMALRTVDELFVGFRCGFAEGSELQVEDRTRDGDVYLDESIELFIDSHLTMRRYYHLLVNADNVQRDEAADRFASPQYDAGWNGRWRSAVSVAGDGWQAEIAIPLGEIGLQEAQGATIGINFCRNDMTVGEHTCWSPTGAGFHQPPRFGVAVLPASFGRPRFDLTLPSVSDPGLGANQQPLTLVSGDRRARELQGRVVTVIGRRRDEQPLDLPELPAGATVTATASYEIQEAGDGAVVLLAEEGGEVQRAAKVAVSLPRALYETIGYRLADEGPMGLWWAESSYKIHREQQPPSEVRDAVELSAAGREFEAAQIVLRPSETMDVTVQVSDFRSDEAAIDADDFRVLEVAYVPVHWRTDSFGFPGDWPDPLPPLEGPLHCEAGQNQPLWLLAHVPPGTPGGVYEGEVTLTAGDVSQSVPVRLRVWDFGLTPQTHTRTAYGVGPPYGFVGAQTEDDRREVFDLYMQVCRDHRISPYRPFSFHPMDIQTLPPMRQLTMGRFELVLPEAGQHPWRMLWDGERIATQRTSMTHFEREGVGYQGTGVSWPYVNNIASVTEVESSEHMRVYEVVAEHTGSAPAARSFRLTFRLYVPAGDNWFGWRLVQMESTDEVEVEIRNYYNIPHTDFEAQQVANGDGFATWSGDEVGFGMLCLDGSVSGLSVKEGASGVTVANGVEPFGIEQGQTHEGWGPFVVYFATGQTSPEAMAERAEWLRGRIDPADPTSYVPAQPQQIAEDRRETTEFSHDFARFDEGAERYLEQFHFNAFNYSAMPGSIAGHSRFSDEYKRLHAEMYGPAIEHLRERGWLPLAYSYWFDEPTEEEYEYVAEGMSVLGENCPGLTRLLTEQPEEPLHDVVDLWVPVLSRFDPEACAARQAAGDEVWWYVCCGPRAPYPNNFIDHPAINHRIRFWMAEKYGVEGSLYWSTTYHGSIPEGLEQAAAGPRNPWEEAMSFNSRGGHWGNGDGFLLYPACRAPSDEPVLEPPVVSLRFEMLRDGLEDREYFWTLREEVERLEAMRPGADRATRRAIEGALRQARQALGAPNRLAKTLTEYTKDPTELLAERRALAEAIEECAAIQ
ncbi:MAG: DUF4091 domain-containing protein [Armatimonadota bacterium]|nr:DUF4091 domain-containing protein [Armatimonadota bacterium]